MLPRVDFIITECRVFYTSPVSASFIRSFASKPRIVSFSPLFQPPLFLSLFCHLYNSNVHAGFSAYLSVFNVDLDGFFYSPVVQSENCMFVEKTRRSLFFSSWINLDLMPFILWYFSEGFWGDYCLQLMWLSQCPSTKSAKIERPQSCQIELLYASGAILTPSAFGTFEKSTPKSFWVC